MDTNTTIEMLKNRVEQFCSARDWDQFHGPNQLSIGVITEAAELLEIFRFKSEEEAHQLVASDSVRPSIADELADVLFFLLRFSQMYGFDLTQSLTRKLAANELKYPVERSKGKNLKYVDL